MTISNEQILSDFEFALEVEFYAAGTNEEVARRMGKDIGVKISVPKIIVGLNQTRSQGHSEFKPTKDHWKIEPDGSGGNDMKELVTGPRDYFSMRIMTIRILQWVDANGWTTEACGLHINISHKNSRKTVKYKISSVDRLKFCLAIDEEYIYHRFPKRRNNVYARSVKDIYPINKFTFSEFPTNVGSRTYICPDTKYYGTNFLKQVKDYLEFRYVGGRNYQKKTGAILEIVTHLCLVIYSCLENPAFTEKEINELRKILLEHKKVVTTFSDFDAFKKNYPQIIVTVDLIKDYQHVKSFWVRVRDPLFDLIVKGNMTKGHLNLDTALGAFEVNEGKLTSATGISNFKFFSSTLDGLFFHCDIFDCTIKNSQLEFCDLVKGNTLTNMKLLQCPIRVSNTLTDCYIDNPSEEIEGTLNKCVIRSGTPGQLAKLTDCIVVDTDKLPRHTF